MRHKAIGLLVTSLLFTLAGEARADWYYKVSCSGACAPHDLAYTYVGGPFSTRESCDEWRDADHFHRDLVNAPGNLGNVDTCDGEDSAEGSQPGDPSRPNPFRNLSLTRFEANLMISGGWAVRERNGMEYEGQSALGLGIDVHGGRPQLSLIFGGSIAITRVDAPFFRGPDGAFIWSVYTGLSSSPFALVRASRIDVRPRLALIAGLAAAAGCGEHCADPSVFWPSVGFHGRVAVGLDMFLGASKLTGLGFELGVPFGTIGDVENEVAPTSIQFESPGVEVRIAVSVRNADVRGW